MRRVSFQEVLQLCESPHPEHRVTKVHVLCCGVATLRRSEWLWGLHFLCFALHAAMTVASYAAGADSDMSVTIYRIKPMWTNRGGNYSYEVVESAHQFVQMHVVTALFFGFSAAMHGVWVFFGWHPRSKPLLWEFLDRCLCYWRWLEYSFSASLMAGERLRDSNQPTRAPRWHPLVDASAPCAQWPLRSSPPSETRTRYVHHSHT